MTDITTGSSMWGTPYIVQTTVFLDTIEIVWRQDAQFSYTSFPPREPEPRIWKEIYEVKNKRTEEGNYIPAQPERYEF